jgi:hypothetical protein
MMSAQLQRWHVELQKTYGPAHAYTKNGECEYGVSQDRRHGSSFHSGRYMLAHYRACRPNVVHMHVAQSNPISTRSVAQ